MNKGKKPLYTLIPLDDFMSLLGIDDRDEKIASYSLLTATYTIEQYCKRRFLRKKFFEHIAYTGDLLLPLREYPVTEILIAHVIPDYREPAQLLEPDLYDLIPDCGTYDDIPFSLLLSPALKRYRKLAAIEVMYYAGYAGEDIPPDLASACLELAAWNMSRYKGKLTKNNEQRTKKGEGFEIAMPENVRLLLEPYKRKLI